jgi:Zn-dependent protease with chaperone function
MAATYFDGVSSRAHAVELGVADGALVVTGDGVERRVAASELIVSEPGASGRRVLHLRGGGSVEADEAELRAVLARLGHRDSLVARHQTRWLVALVALLAIVALAGASWMALPWLADRAARIVPENALARVGAEALALLDRTHFEPSELPPERRDAIGGRLEALAAAESLPTHRLSFRRSPELGANAFALPSGDIVLTDELVALAEHEDEILGVLAHELGHLEGRHALRSMLQASVAAVAIAVYLGDLSTLGAGVSGFLINARYSRDFEREADAWAAALLRRHDVDPSHLGAILARMEAQAGAGAVLGGYLSTHPVTEERVRALEAE